MSFPSSPQSPNAQSPSIPSSPHMQLTPRSKIKALLGSLDGDSDKENQDGQSEFVKKASTRVERRSSPQAGVLDQHSTSPSATTESAQGGHTELGQSVKQSVQQLGSTEQRNLVDTGPLGRSEKKTHSTLAEQSDETEKESEGEGAYSRVKKLLMARQNKSTTQTEDESARISIQSVRAATPSDPSSRSSPVKPNADGSPAISPYKARRTQAQSGFPKSPQHSNKEKGRDLTQDSLSDSDTSSNKQHQSRLQQLVAQKRKERLAKEREAEEQAQSEESDDPLTVHSSQRQNSRKKVLEVESEDDQEPDAGKKLTQQTRPTRKASKKAQEEMNRETQRMSRNMQLTHEARTKVKYTPADLFKKLGFRQATKMEDSPNSSSPARAVPQFSETDGPANADTPPSSPPSAGETLEQQKGSLQELPVIEEIEAVVAEPDSDADNPSLEQLLEQSMPKSSAPDELALPKVAPAELTSPTKNKKKASLRQFAKSAAQSRPLSDSEDDLEIEGPVKNGRLAALDGIPVKTARESHSIHALKALAHLNESDGSKMKKNDSLTPAQLHLHLRKRAREQALVEKTERIQALREKGIVVQTEEEKEQDQMQLENMLEKARQEAMELAKREREAAKREGNGAAYQDDLPDSDGDEDFLDEEEMEYSGSDEERPGEDADDENEEGDDEEEEDDEEDQGEEDEDELQGNSLLDDRAAEANESDSEAEVDVETNAEDEASKGIEDGPEFPKPLRKSRLKRKLVVSDEEDESEEPQEEAVNLPSTTTTPKASLANAFGFANPESAGPRLSQVFGGTMAESQTQTQLKTPSKQASGRHDPLDFLRARASPAPSQMLFDSPAERPSPLIVDSQSKGTPSKEGIETGFGLDPDFLADSPQPFIGTQPFELPEATQDGGFETVVSPVRNSVSYTAQGEQSTIDTVLLSRDAAEGGRKGRLQRGHANIEVEASPEPTEKPDATNAFEYMRRISRRPQESAAYERKTSKAKDMFEEQAEESEDEYAGLGGASDDESQGEIDEETKRMIDDESNERVNERAMAAFHADKARADDEKLVNKLYRDINNGGLRRKRDTDFDDLLGSDDEAEIMARRRVAKQKEFEKMRKALYGSDNKLAKMAENPKQRGFTDTIEDWAKDDEAWLLEQPEESQSQPLLDRTDSALDVLQVTSSNAPKRKFGNIDGTDENSKYAENRPPPHLRRTPLQRKPATLADVRSALSEMLGEPESIRDSQPGHEIEEAEEDEIEEEQVAPGIDSVETIDWVSSPSFHRRTQASAARSGVIDRMALKRASSSTMSASNTSTARLAFQATSHVGSGAFKVPSLLRRATTNASNASSESFTESDKSTGASTSGWGKEIVRMGGSKKSSINYHVREKERRAKVQELEKQREEGRIKIGKMRRGAVGLGQLAGGGFE